MATIQRRGSSRPDGSRGRGGGGGNNSSQVRAGGDGSQRSNISVRDNSNTMMNNNNQNENNAYTNSLPSNSNNNQQQQQQQQQQQYQQQHQQHNQQLHHIDSNNMSSGSKSRRNNSTSNNKSASSSPNPIISAWEARRRRKGKGSSDNNEEGQQQQQNDGNNSNSRRQQRKSKKDLPDEEYDPYDSDPGESYRDHCERIQGESSKSCLAMPRFLKDGKFGKKLSGTYINSQVGNSNSHSQSQSSGLKTKVMIDQQGLSSSSRSHHHDDKSGSTSPPSPFHSEPDTNMSPMKQQQQQQQRNNTHHQSRNPLQGQQQQHQQQQHATLLDPTTLPPGTSPSSLPRDLARVRYSLRTSIGDGTDVQPGGGSAAMMERRELRPNNIHINVSHWSDFGGRNYMEDRYAIEDMGAVQVEVSPVPLKSSQSNNKNGNDNESGAGVEVTFGNSSSSQRKNRRLKMPLTWLGVFDGHGGDKASQYCSDWLSSYVRNEESFPFDLGYAMKNAFTSIDDDFVATGQPDGSTCCAATLVGGRRIVCANAGDSRAIVVRRDGTVVRLSRDHKPGMPDETRRISELGGRVIYWGRWRVEGLLAVSRSVGDASLKPYVTAEPEVCEYDIGKDDWFLVLSSDGVWDVMDNEEAAHVVIASSCVMEDGRLKIDTNRFKWAARNLCDHAKSCGSTDNFSCVVVDLKSCGNPKAKAAGRYSP